MQTLTGTVAAQPAPEQFLGSISSEKVRRSLSTLTRPDAYRWDTLFPRVDGLGAAGEDAADHPFRILGHRPASPASGPRLLPRAPPPQARRPALHRGP